MTRWFISISLCYISLFFSEMRRDEQENLKAPEGESINTEDKEAIPSRWDTCPVEQVEQRRCSSISLLLLKMLSCVPEAVVSGRCRYSLSHFFFASFVHQEKAVFYH